MTTATTVDTFLADVKAAAQVPPAEGRITDAEVLRMADALLVRAIGRAVYLADDGRWCVTADDVPVVSGTASYLIPSRAWSGSIRSVSLVQASSGTVTPLDYVDTADIDYYQESASWPVRPVYTIEGDTIVLLPTPTDSSYSLRVRYLRRPSRMILTTSCALISSVGASALTVASYPSGWSSLDIDVVRSTHHATPLEDDVSVAASGGTTLTRGSGSFATSGVLAVAAGDYACPVGYTCVPQVPENVLGWLLELTARDVCVALGDNEGAGGRERLAAMAGADASRGISERNRTRPHVINRSSPLRVGGMGRTLRRGR